MQILYFQFGMKSVSRVYYMFDKQGEAKLQFVFFLKGYLGNLG